MNVRRLRLWLLLILFLMEGCAAPATPPSPSPPALPPTPTPDFEAPSRAGQAFLAAWERSDYPAMYALLAPSLRQGLDEEKFTEAYRTALTTATVITLTAQPLQLGLSGTTAWLDFHESWQTALFGRLQANNRLPLVQEEGRWWVEWRREVIWPDLSGGNRLAVEYQVPPRANIYDRNGAGLAVESTIVTVGVVPGQIEDEQAVLAALAALFDRPQEEIRALYAGQPDDWFIPIGELSAEESLAHDDLLSLPGILRRERTGRTYPDAVAPHVIGWVGPIPAEKADLYRQRGYRADAQVGIAGLEAWGESLLAGRNGGLLYVIAEDGSYVKGLAERRPQRGRSLYTTIDRDFQLAVQSILSDRQGSIVALDVHSGAVLAMASGPGFDNNLFVNPQATEARQHLLADPRHPLFNRATQGTYPLGSVFKIVTMAAGMDSGLVEPQSTFYCPGYWDGLGAANRKSCWLKSGHGTLTLESGLIQSCDVVFYEVGYRLDGQDPNLLPTYGSAFGLGEATGLRELPEATGLMPSPAWKQSTYLEGWATGDSVNLAIGQGFLLVTPLQVARMMAAVANGGTLYRPYLVARTDDGTGYGATTEPTVVGRLPIDEAELRVIQEALHAVTTSPHGTATFRFRGLSVPVAGKTGTAEAPGEEAEPHAWFAGYFPADDPQVALVVMVENGGEGSTIAAPLFRQVVEAYYGLPLTPLPPEAEAKP